jgi:hypothetical protein
LPRVDGARKCGDCGEHLSHRSAIEVSKLGGVTNCITQKGFVNWRWMICQMEIPSRKGNDRRYIAVDDILDAKEVHISCPAASSVMEYTDITSFQ